MLAILVMIVAFVPPQEAASARFRGWFEAARAGTLAVPDEVECRARTFRYVFVGGFGSERMPGYFGANVRELRARGVPAGAIHYVYPSSDRTTAENGPETRRQFYEIAAKGPERLVVLGHSRGACDTLAFALADPAFVEARVEAMFLVQGPFGGTSLAGYIRGDGPAIDRATPWRHRLPLRLIGAAETTLNRMGYHGGIVDLTPDASRRAWIQARRERSEAAAVVGPKVFYVRTSAGAPGRRGIFKGAAFWYLSSHGGPNDGLVAVEDQWLPGLGTSLAVLDCGHGDLTRNGWTSRSRTLQRALTQSVLMAVASPAP